MGKFAKTGERVTTATLSRDLRVYAARRWPLDKDERRKERLATLLNMTKRRVRSLWENEGTARPRGEEIERIKALIGAEEEEAYAEAYRQMDARFAAMEAELAALRTAIAATALAGEGAAHSGSGRGPDRQGQGVPRRRSTDH